MSIVTLARLTQAPPTRRPDLFERLPAVFRDPERFRPAQVTEGDLTGATAWVSPDRGFSVGSAGDQVAELQRALARARHDPGPDDGDFGPRTEDAVRAFQRQRGLVIDGLVGPQTVDELTAPFLRRFLAGLSDVLEPLVSTMDNLAAYVSVSTAPDDVLSWLAWIVGADTMEEWGRERRRAVVAHALDLHRSRGTVPGIAALVALHLDLPLEDVVVTDGGETSWDVDPDAELSTTPDRTIRVALPARAGDFRGLHGERLRHVLARTLPVGFSVELAVRAVTGAPDASPDGGGSGT